MDKLDVQLDFVPCGSYYVNYGLLEIHKRGFVSSVDTKRNHSLTKRAPDAGDSGAIPSFFLRLSIFPVGRRSAARPSAGNANRWALEIFSA
jgi:hypothetical protein